MRNANEEMKEFLSLSYSQLRRNYVIFSGVVINPILQLACEDCHLIRAW